MKSKQYRLSIVKNKIVLKEAAEDISSELFSGALGKIVKSVAGTLGNVISTLFSTYAYLIKSIVRE